MGNTFSPNAGFPEGSVEGDANSDEGIIQESKQKNYAAF